MVSDNSVTIWLDGAKAGNEQAIGKLWDRYFQRLVRLAARKLPGHQRRDMDEEDVALSAFHSFCERVGRGQFPVLAGRDELWRLLVVITTRKALALARNRACQKRGGGKVVGESALLERPDAGEEGLAQFLGREPGPDLAAQLAEDYKRLMEALVNDTLRTVALMRLEGHSAGEIGRRLAISPRSVERKLRVIRQLWERIALGEDCGPRRSDRP
jgi:DNA-directed RNA polymerase specialized sigma24 family protein